jgi:hypothetical protein
LSFRLLDWKPQMRLASGALNAGGSLEFFITNTSTPKSVFGDESLSTNLGAVIDLEADARTLDDIWLATDVEYRVTMKDSLGAIVAGFPLDHVRSGDAAGAAPPDPTAGADGDSLLTDGTDWYFQALREVPDPTGHASNVLLTDGDLIYWGAQQTIPTYDSTNLPGGITQDTAKLVIGKLMILWGNGTAPTSGTTATSVGVTFGTAFTSSLLHVSLIPTIGPVTGESAHCSAQATGGSTTGFTANFFAGAEDGGGSLNISTAVTFTWVAFGLMT